MSLVLTIRCDICGDRIENCDPGYKNWSVLRWQAGLLSNTRPRPDKHICPKPECREKRDSLKDSKEEE